MTKKKIGTVVKDRHQGDPKPDFEYVDDEFLGTKGSTSVDEIDEEELESKDGFAHLQDDEDDEDVIRDPNNATQGRTPGVADVTSDEISSFKDRKARQEFLDEAPLSPYPLGHKHVGALRSDPTRMDSSTPQAEKDEIEPGRIIELTAPKAEGLVVRKKISEDVA